LSILQVFLAKELVGKSCPFGIALAKCNSTPRRKSQINFRGVQQKNTPLHVSTWLDLTWEFVDWSWNVTAKDNFELFAEYILFKD